MSGKSFLTFMLSNAETKLLRFFANNEEGNTLKELKKQSLLAMHPRNVVMTQAITCAVFEVDFSYTTIRGNRKSTTKILIVPKGNPQSNIEDLLFTYIKKHNLTYDKRPLLNVQILNSSFLGMEIIA